MITPPFYPARPINGGPLSKALPKSGDWYYEPKFNGWRALVHVPSGTMFNRKLEHLSIESEFKTALTMLHNSPFIWLDCEALERRHGLGCGSLIVLDAIEAVAGYDLMCKNYRYRHDLLRNYFLNDPMGLEFLEPETAAPDKAFLCPRLEDHTPPDTASKPFRLQLWEELLAANKKLGCEFYEGVVAKRADSLYPRQHRSAEQEFPYWMKHRWAF